MYYCSKCGRKVIVIKDQPPIKACHCKAPIILDMGATVKGVGGLNG
jgi:DNA-directed RNA polymerase subunit RPC12/RpoP